MRKGAAAKNDQRTFQWLVAFAVVAQYPLTAHAVNKCTDASGRVFYQDAPCQPHDSPGRVDLSGAGTGNPTSPESRFWQSEIARQQRNERINEAIANRQVMIGMSADEVVRSWGAPTRVNSSIGSYGRHEQWVYSLGGVRAQYVYIQNGKVTSMQSPDR